MLTFEVDRHLFALPISGIIEVAEAGAITCIPTLPRVRAGVMNWHGDALPVVSSRLLLADGDAAELALSGDGDDLVHDQVLVLSERSDGVARLGLPISGVHGIVDGPPMRLARSGEVVAERRPQDGRVMSVLDPRQVVERARKVIRRLAA